MIGMEFRIIVMILQGRLDPFEGMIFFFKEEELGSGPTLLGNP